MNYIKSVIVLKQIEDGFGEKNKPISAITRIEIEDGIATLFFSPINIALKNSGEFFLFVLDSEKYLHSFALSNYPKSKIKNFDSTPNIKSGYAVGLCYIVEDIPLTIAFNREKCCTFTITDFNRAVAERCLNIRKSKPKDKPLLKEEKDELFNAYNDEAVATENYYDYHSIEFGELNGESGIKNVLPSCGEQEKEYKSQTDADGDKVKEDFSRLTRFTEKYTYYQTVKDEIDSLLAKFPEENDLKKIFLGSKWAKVFYAENKYYVVGVIWVKESVKYICYGVPSIYSPTPPKELEGYATFIPLSVLDMKGKGYFMMFQNAITGECVHIKSKIQ